MKSIIQVAAALALLSVLTVGCGDPLKFPQEISETRVLGVRVESASGHAAAVPGEDLSVEILLAGVDGPVESQIAYQLCAAENTSRGVPRCAAAPYAQGIISASQNPRLFLEDFSADPGRFSILGVACDAGTPELAEDPIDWVCLNDDGSTLDGLRFSFDTQAEQEPQNKNPDLSALKVKLGKQEAHLEDINVQADCDDAPEVSDDEVTLSFDLGAGVVTADQGLLLTVSHFSTAGRYERQFTSLEIDEEGGRFEIEWAAPEQPGAVKNYLVVRDGRGGVSWASFSTCVR